jgi:hypothetical protein
MTRVCPFRALALAGWMALSGGCAMPDWEQEALEEVVLQGASTPAEHEALRDYFRTKATRARAEAFRHARLARAYLGAGHARTAVEMREHCERIAAEQESLAAEYDKIARLHEREALAADR